MLQQRVLHSISDPLFVFFFLPTSSFSSSIADSVSLPPGWSLTREIKKSIITWSWAAFDNASMLLPGGKIVAWAAYCGAIKPWHIVSKCLKLRKSVEWQSGRMSRIPLLKRDSSTFWQMSPLSWRQSPCMKLLHFICPWIYLSVGVYLNLHSRYTPTEWSEFSLDITIIH